MRLLSDEMALIDRLRRLATGEKLVVEKREKLFVQDIKKREKPEKTLTRKLCKA